MRVFLTGATGFIGSAIAAELIGAGHQVRGLVRSDVGAASLRAAGAEPFSGTIEHLGSLRDGADGCDAIIHTAFDHDFSHFAANCEKDRRVIMALGEAFAGSARPLVITGVTAIGSAAPGQPADEDRVNLGHPNPRVASEQACAALIERGLNLSVVRLSQIHNEARQGLVTEMIALARRTGVSAWVGEGGNRWSAAHLLDTAQLYRLALEGGRAGARYHATAEQGIAFRQIAERIGERLGVPSMSIPADAVAAHFGWLAKFADADMSADSSKTRERLDWSPKGPGLLTSLDAIS